MSASEPHEMTLGEPDDLIDALIEIVSDKSDSDEDSTGNGVTGPRVPRVFKCDVRWSYIAMYTNSLNSGDLAMAYSFLKTFTRPDFCHTVHGAGPPVTMPPTRGIEEYIKNWTWTSVLSPDAVVRPSNVSVRNFPDGTSQVSSNILLSRTLMYEKPNVDLPSIMDFDTEMSSATGAKRKVPMSWATAHETSNLYALGIGGVRKASNYERTRRIRASRFSADLNDSECLFLHHLKAIEPGEPKPLSDVRAGKYTGVVTLSLDANGRITSFDLVVSDMKFDPVDF